MGAPGYEPADLRSNVPLAAGNLASFASQSFAGRPVTFEVLDRAVLDRAGDAAAARIISEKNPDILAATLYCWSSFRTLEILKKCRLARPEMLIIVGGAEVDKGNDFLADYACHAFDLAASGEGEELFVEVVAARFCELQQGGGRFHQDHYRAIHGIGVAREPGVVDWAPPRQPVQDLSRLPSPYLHDAFPLIGGGIQHIETARGCVFECDFCFYHADFRKVRTFPRERVAAEIRHALDRDVTDLYLMDPTFNGHSGYRETLRFLRPELQHRDASVHTELRAEPMNVTNVKELSDAGITSVEVGLQTVTPEALKAVGRLFERDRFANGCRHLLDAGIRVEIGTIIGLPSDTPRGMQQTFQYAFHECGEAAETVPFVLSLLPATVLRERAADFGIRYRKFPPYTVLETPGFSEEGIRDSLEQYTNIFDRDLDPIPTVRCVIEGGEETGALEGGDLVRRILVDPGVCSVAELAARSRSLADRVEAVCCVIFTNLRPGVAELHKKIQAFLEPIRTQNPHGLLEVILECAQGVAPGNWIIALSQSIRMALPAIDGHYLNEHLRYIVPPGADMSMRVIAMLPVETADGAGAQIADAMPVLWRVRSLQLDSLEYFIKGPFETGSMYFERADPGDMVRAASMAGDDAADLRFAGSACQRALDAAAELPAPPPETICVLGVHAAVVAVRRRC